MFSFGIEHEVAFVNSEGIFLDFENTRFEDFTKILDLLPDEPLADSLFYHNADYLPNKKWYVEGMERHNLQGVFSGFIPKGIEIRTRVHASIPAVIQELTGSYNQLCAAAKMQGFFPYPTSFHPYKSTFEPQPPLNEYERERYKLHLQRKFPHIYMLSFGPDFNLSATHFSPEEVLDAGKKLIFYSSYLVPFSFSPCQYKGKKWKGKSIRTFFRNGDRQAVRMYVKEEKGENTANPNPIKVARMPSEVGRMEFKTFDSCADFSLYAALFALLKGVILDKTLKGRAEIPNVYLHKVAANHGFDNKNIRTTAEKLLAAAHAALEEDTEKQLLMPLFAQFQAKEK